MLSELGLSRTEEYICSGRVRIKKEPTRTLRTGRLYIDECQASELGDLLLEALSAVLVVLEEVKGGAGG